MSLLITFELFDFPVQDVVQHLKESSVVGGLEALPISQKKSNIWHVWESDEEDDLIVDDAPEWTIKPYASKALVEILAQMTQASPNGLSFSVAWVGEPLTPQPVTLGELEAIIGAGVFGPNTVYEYRKP